MKKRRILVLSFMLLLNFVMNIMGNSLLVMGLENNILNVRIRSNPQTVNSGEKIEFNLEYDILKNEDIKGKTLTFSLTEKFKDIKPSVPEQHFVSKDVQSGNVVATFGDVSTAIAGYLNVSAIAQDVSSKENITLEVRLDGELLATSTVTINPKENSYPNDNPGGQPIQRRLLKSVEGEYDYTVNKPVEGKVVNYTLYINEGYSDLYGIDIRDNLPEGMELIESSVIVTEEPQGGYAKKLDNNFYTGYYGTSSNSLYIVFNGSTNSMYRIEYKARIIADKEQYINTAELYEGGYPKEKSSTTVTVKEDPTMIKKDVDNGIVSSVGDNVKYTLEINPNNKFVKECRIEDKFPQGMELIKDTIVINEIDIERNEKNVTNDFINQNKIKIFSDNLSIDVGDTNNKYIVYYYLKVKDIKKEYNNIVSMNFLDGNATDNKVVKYLMNSGAINAEKLVDKERLNGNETNQKLTYSIKFQCFGFFEKDKIQVVDELDSRLKNITFDIPNIFEAKVEGNILSFINSKGPIDYGDNFEIKIFADASDIPSGNIISNVAKINNTKTKPVYTKKGYKFIAKKVDNITGKPLEKAVFQVLDENKNIINIVTSDINGLIEGYLESPGMYFLREKEAPANYEKNLFLISFEVTNEHLGSVLDIGNISNTKIEEPKIPPVEEPETPPVEEPETPPIEEPETPPVEEPEIPPVEEPETPPMEEPETPPVEEPETPPIEEPETPPVEELKMSTVEKPKSSQEKKDESIRDNIPKTGDRGYFIYLILIFISGLGLIINNKLDLK